MVVSLFSAAVHGMDCMPVDIEVDISGTWPGFQIIGLPDAAIQEARERIRSAWKHSSLSFPQSKRVLINLAPAHIRKIGTMYDVPMAIGMLQADRNHTYIHDHQCFLGELGLDGALRPIRGVLAITLFAKNHGITELFVPQQNAEEAAIVSGMMVYGVSHFRDLVAHLTGEQPLLPYIPQKQYKKQHNQPSIYDFSYIKGQTSAKRALEIAAAGNHNIILQGPPGSGKTLLAKTLPSIMPPLSEQEAIEVTTIYSIAGLLDTESGLLKDPPFRTPHHTASSTSLVGGGSIPRPGEISLSHRGILFLDEFPEFPKKVIEQLRQPLEDGTITVTRASGNATFPAEFLCIASMNPCPCGFASDPERACQCSQFQIQSYQKKLSGPILDRFDLFVEAPRVDIQALQNTQDCPEPSDTVRKRVSIARKKQLERAAETTCFTNSELSQRGIQQFCTLEKEAETLLGQANEQLQLSARAYFRCIKVARTIADLAESKDIKTEHILEALRFRRITS